MLAGKRPYPNEIEGVILTVPGVQDVIVKGEPNPLVGNIVVCYVRKSPNALQDQVRRAVRNACRERLEKFKRPMRIYFSEGSFYSQRFKKQMQQPDGL